MFMRRLVQLWQSTVVYRFLWAVACSLMSTETEKKRVRRVEALYRRRYEGRRLAGLRAEVHIHHAGMVIVWRTVPGPFRKVLIAVAAVMAFTPVGPWALVPLFTKRGDPNDLGAILDSMDATPLFERLRQYQARGGPKGHPLRALWRAHVASFALGLSSTNDLIRRLQDDPEFRMLCGFSSLPHRTTFNRFITRLGHHVELVDACLVPLVDQLAKVLPDFGKNVAVDSTVVDTHSNPNRTNAAGECSDPEASWTKKHAASGKEETEWHFGYKFHLAVDATYSLPIAGHVTTAKRHDSPEFPRLMERAQGAHSWFSPEYVMADKGYDSRKNHEYVQQQGGALIAPTRRSPSRDKLYEGIYTSAGVPTCVGMVPMEYVKSDPERGHLYRCRREGCHLRTRQGVRYCADEYWEGRRDNPRLFGPLRRNSPAWKALYRLRWSVERVFKSLKESRRLEGHYIRGLRRIALLAAMSTLVYTATALQQVRAGEQDYRWMVRRVA